MSDLIHIIVVDDHPLMRQGIVGTLKELAPHLDVVGQCGSADEALTLVRQIHPDMILLDIGIPGGGLETASRIKIEFPSVKIVMLTASERPIHLTTALSVGASGYLLKGISGQELVWAVTSVATGHTYITPELAGKILSPGHSLGTEHANARNQIGNLTARETEVVKLLTQGKTNREIAGRLSVTEKTVKYYLTNVFMKLHVKNRLEAVVVVRDAIAGTGDSINDIKQQH